MVGTYTTATATASLEVDPGLRAEGYGSTVGTWTVAVAASYIVSMLQGSAPRVVPRTIPKHVADGGATLPGVPVCLGHWLACA